MNGHAAAQVDGSPVRSQRFTSSLSVESELIQSRRMAEIYISAPEEEDAELACYPIRIAFRYRLVHSLQAPKLMQGQLETVEKLPVCTLT